MEFNKKLKVMPLLFMSICLTGCSKDPGVTPITNELGQIQTQISSSSCVDSNYESTIKKLKKAGFKNFKITFEGDVILGWFVTEDAIDTISINGVSNFEKDSYFDTKSVVFLTVHSKKEDIQTITSPVDGQLPILYSSTYFNGTDKLATGQKFSNIGFKNISYNPIQDCSSQSSYSYNDTDGFTIEGNSLFFEYSFYDINSPLKISYHTIPGDYCSNGLEHSLIEGNRVEPTCTEKGHIEGSHCSVCQKEFDDAVELPALGHNPIVDKSGVEATCISKGLSEESHCSRCGEVLSVQHETEINPNNHINKELVPGTKATCVSHGLSDGYYCNDCHKTVVEQQETPLDPNNHTNVVTDDAVRPSNGKDGHTAGSHCEDCHKTISTGNPISWSGSSEEKQATNELESIFSKEYAKKAVITGMCNYFSSDVFDSTGSYVVASKLHSYSYASTKYKVTSSGTWKWAGEKKWRFEGFTIYGGDYKMSYPLYGYAEDDGNYVYLTGMNNGKSNNPSQYITYSDAVCFKISHSLLS